MHFIQLNTRCEPEFSDILIAELAELDFDSFEENKNGFAAYVEEEKIDFDAIKALLERYAGLTALHYSFQKIDRENWNQTWESNYQPIVIKDQILVKAPFHQIDESFPVVITIIPKMSFGTGHHATTSQMLTHLLEYKPLDFKVIDAGTGTGILAIMAEKMGAFSVLAFDNDPWCIENCKENFNLNHSEKCEVRLARSMHELSTEKVDMVLANINKNVLLSEMALYAKALKSNGLLLLSGFYTEDLADIETSANHHQLTLIDQSAKENWACLVLRKN